jgi:hypothetical protein
VLFSGCRSLLFPFPCEIHNWENLLSSGSILKLFFLSILLSHQFIVGQDPTPKFCRHLFYFWENKLFTFILKIFWKLFLWKTIGLIIILLHLFSPTHKIDLSILTYFKLFNIRYDDKKMIKGHETTRKLIKKIIFQKWFVFVI